jgi:hypothetical protein
VLVDEDRQDLGLQAASAAHLARDLSEVLGPAHTLAVGVGLQVLALDVRDDTLEAR